MLEKVKLALRISHDLLDDAIEDEISEARADMVRSGLSEEVANNDEYPMTVGCILTYCRYKHSVGTEAERYFESYQYQLDCLRKSS